MQLNDKYLFYRDFWLGYIFCTCGGDIRIAVPKGREIVNYAINVGEVYIVNRVMVGEDKIEIARERENT